MGNVSLRVEILSDTIQKILHGLLQTRIRRCGHSRVNVWGSCFGQRFFQD